MPATKQSTRSGTRGGAAKVARGYIEAIDRHDLDAAAALWAQDARDNFRGQFDVVGPEGVRQAIGDLLTALPDLRMEIVQQVTQGERSAVQWRATGTFAGGPLNGIEPTGARLEMEGVDLMTIREGRIVANDAFADAATLARQIGMLPDQGSKAEQRVTSAFNARTRLRSRVAGDLEEVAEGVWSLMGDPGHCRVYFLADEGGVTMYDAGGRPMTRAVAAAAAKLGGLKRIVLGHGHTDHRGTAPKLGVPVLCHPDEVVDAEGSGGFRYWGEGLPKLSFPIRQIHLVLHRRVWDGGPVKIDGTVSEGDEVAGFRVVHLPGHAPGLIGLWRESDRLALVSDTFYTTDMWGRDTPPHVPQPEYNIDTAQAQASIRKLAALEPTAAWPGHAKPVTGPSVGAELQAAAERF